MSGTTSAPDWAKQQILERIANATERSASSLSAILSGKAEGINQLIDGAKTAGETLVKESEQSKKVRQQMNKMAEEDLKKSLDAKLRQRESERMNESRWAREKRRQTGQMWNQYGRSLTNSSSLLQITTTKMTNSLSSIPVIGTALGGALGLVSGFISSVMQSKDAFIDMVDSGILFDGSLTQFRTALGNAGLSTEQFSAIVSQSGRAISVLGESRFLETTNRLRGFFDDFGYSLSQGNQYFAEYLENSRLSGSVYFRTVEQHAQSFRENMVLMREQSRLTGVSVRQQREQQQALRREARYQALLRSVTPEQRKYIESQESSITSVAGEQGAQFAREFFQMALVGNVERGGMLQTLMSFGQAQAPLGEMAARVRAGEQLNTDQLLRTIADLPSDIFRTLSLRGPEAEKIMAIRQSAEARFRPEGMAPPSTSELTAETRALIGAQNTITQLMGQFNAAITELGEKLLKIVTPALEQLNETLRAFSTAGRGEGFRAMAQSFGLSEEGAGMRIASAFDRGILAGISETLTSAFKGVIDAFYAKMTQWGNEFLSGLRDLLPSWLRGRSTSAQAPLQNPQVQAEIQRLSSGNIDPTTLIPAQPQAATSGPRPLIAPGAMAAERLTPTQIAAMEIQAERLIDAANQARGTSREAQLAQQANELLARIERATTENTEALRQANRTLREQ